MVYGNHFSTISNISECMTDLDCPDHLACGEDKECVAPPCSKCFANTYCEVKNHTITGICNESKKSQFYKYNLTLCDYVICIVYHSEATISFLFSFYRTGHVLH